MYDILPQFKKKWPKCQASDAEKKYYSSSEERAVVRYGFSESSYTLFWKKNETQADMRGGNVLQSGQWQSDRTDISQKQNVDHSLTGHMLQKA